MLRRDCLSLPRFSHYFPVRGRYPLDSVQGKSFRSKVANRQNSIDSLKTEGETLVGELRTTKTSMATELERAKSAVESLAKQEKVAKGIAEGLVKRGQQVGVNVGKQIGKLVQEFNQKVDSKRIVLKVSPFLWSCS